MRNALIRIVAAGALAAGMLAVAQGPAAAAGPAVATSVALNANASCANASLDLGVVTGDIDTETGLATALDGEVMDEWSQDSNLDNFNGVSLGYTIWATADPGTVIGSYASIGVAPLSPDTAAEWFVLYQCGAVGENTVLYTCYGDLGTCPTTAAEGAAAALDVRVDDPTPDPGQTITVTADCAYPLGGALLRDGDSVLDGDSADVVDGSFSIELTVPETVTPGTELTIQVDCGLDGSTILTTDVPIVVAGQVTGSTTTSTTEPVATPAPVQPATPSFTG